ncbi:MAG: alpha-galactosidase [Actinomycetota bacterium]|nr:alpha-galactosidase [Actinomycetota bacterium]
MARVTFIGAGSVIFTRMLVNDLLAFDELRDDYELVLHDIDERRLRVAGTATRHVCEVRGAGARVRETLDRREALEGADYVIFTVQVGGHEATVRDFEIPRRHGIRATIGDTLGIGGVFRALRTFPVICETARELAELSPNAWLLNYTNPMAMLCWSVYAGTPLERVVGLCHSVQGTAGKLARLLGLEPAEIEYEVAGVNHLAFFLRLASVGGDDLYPRLATAIAADPEGRGRTVRAELHRRLGYFVTESSEHAAEYVPWFLGDAEQHERFRIPLDEYVRRSAANLLEFERVAAAVGNGDGVGPPCGHEYAPRIVHALETGEPFRFNGNVRNDGLIDNLPAGACVEVPCTADGDGIRPHPVGELPPQLAALDRAYLAVCELAVRAYVEGRRDWVYHACAVDPGVTGQGVSLERIWAACDELFEAHGELIPRELRERAPV